MPDPNDLTTLAALKLWLGATTGTDDQALAALITAASYDFLQRCARTSLLSNAYTETRNGEGGTRLILMNYPVTAVASVTVAGNGPGAVPDLIPASPGLGQPGFVFDRFGISLICYDFCRGTANVSVAYTAGFATVPPEVTQAVNGMCASWWKRRQWTDQSSKNLAGEVVTFRREDIAPEAQRVVDHYKRRIAV